MKLIAIIPIAFILFPCLVCAQDSISIQPKDYLNHIAKSSASYERKISNYSQKLLSRFNKEERRIKRKLQRIDPQKSGEIFKDSIRVFSNSLKKRIYSRQPFSAYMDTTLLTLKFLDKTGINHQKLLAASGNLESLQGKLQLTENIQNYIRTRKKELQQQLLEYGGFTRNFQRLSKQAYYYREQLNEYKSLYEHPSKLENKAISALKQLPAYNEFIQKNSLIGSLFNLPSDYNETRGLEGLQTRNLTDQLITQRLGTDAVARAAVTQQMEQARDQLNELKNKFSSLGNTGEIPDVPGFKPNALKTKSFLQRLEYGGNIQFQRNTSYYPTTSDIAAQVGYKFHKNGSAGLGLAYKLGLGQGWNHVVFTHQGIGLRSFADWKIKGTFYLNGGYELNYTKVFNSVRELRGNWQKSTLIGVSKKYKINSKLKGNILVLYDFLAADQHPPTNKFKIRFGYTM